MATVKKTTFRFLLIILFITIAVAAPFALQKLRQYGAELSARLIIELVKQESNDYYKISYTSAKLSLFDRAIDISGLVISPDTTNTTVEGEQLPVNSFEILIPQLHISIESFIALFLFEELKIQALRIIDPEIVMVRTNEPSAKRPFSLEAGDLYVLISQYLKIFKIDRFNIQSGTFSFDKENNPIDSSGFNIKSLDFGIENFLIDAETGTEKGIFFSENIELVIHDQVIYLTDSIHQFAFDKLTISTSTELISFDGIKIQPRQNGRASFQTNPENLNLYNIAIPTLQLGGVDFLKAYTDNQLIIEKINVLSPHIVLYEGESKGKKKAVRSNSLSALLIEYFDAVQVENLSLQDGNLNIMFENEKVVQDFQLADANINVENFHLDSLSFDVSGNVDYFDHIEIDFDNYQFNLPDSVHQLVVQRFKLSTKKRIIQADSVVLVPCSKASGNNNSALYHVNLPSITLDGFDWDKMASHRKLYFSSLKVPSPWVKIVTSSIQSNKQIRQELALKNFGKPILKIVNELVFDSAMITNGDLHIVADDEELLGLSNLDLAIGKFKIDKASLESKEQWFYSEDVDLRFTDFDIEFPDKSHAVYLSDFWLNTQAEFVLMNQVSVKPIHLESVPRQHIFNVSIEKLGMHGFDIGQLIDNKNIMVDSLLVINPDIDVFQDKNVSTSFETTKTEKASIGLNSFDIGYLILKNGRSRQSVNDKPILNIGNYNLAISGLSLDSAKLQARSINHFIKDLVADAKEIRYIDEATGHQFKLEQISIHQERGDMTLQGIQINPDASSDPKVKLQYFSDKWSLKGFALEEMLKNNALIIDELIVPKASLHLTTSKNEDKQKSPRENLESIYDQLSERMGLVKLDKLRFDSLLFDVESGKDSINFPNLSLDVTNFTIDKALPYDQNKPFFGHITLTASRPIISIEKLPFDVSFASAQIRSSNGKITADGVHFKPKNSEYKIPSIKIPRLELLGIDMASFWNNDVLDISGLVLHHPSISLSNNAIDTTATASLPEQINIPFGHLKVDTITAINGNVSVTLPDQNANKALVFNDLLLAVKNLYIDSTKKFLGNKLFFADDVQLSGKQFNFLTDDRLVGVNVGSYHLGSSSGNIELADISILPQYEKYALGQKLGVQTDWIKGTINTIKFEHLDIRKLINGKGITTSSVEVDGVVVDVFRDKRQPFPVDQRKMLPHMALMQSELPIEINNFSLQNGKITYEEFAEEGSEPGSLFFDDMEVKMVNVVNTPLKLSANKMLNASISAKLMGGPKILVGFNTNLHVDDGEFTLTGAVDPFDLSIINQMLEHVAFLKVRSGQSKGTELSFTANNIYAMGEMKFQYEGLKILLLSKDTTVHSSLGHAIGSFFANTFIVRTNNPNFLLLTKGDIYFERDPAKSIFNYWSKSFLSGVVSSIGAKSNKRDIKKKNKENLRINKERMREEKYLEDKIGIYD